MCKSLTVTRNSTRLENSPYFFSFDLLMALTCALGRKPSMAPRWIYHIPATVALCFQDAFHIRNNSDEELGPDPRCHQAASLSLHHRPQRIAAVWVRWATECNGRRLRIQCRVAISRFIQNPRSIFRSRSDRICALYSHCLGQEG